MTKIEIIDKYENAAQISDEQPDEGFNSFYEEHRDELWDRLSGLKEKAANVEGLEIKAGLMFPPNAKINEEIKEFCAIPFRREDGAVFACEGIVENWKGCPPHSPAVTETLEQISRSSAFLIMQFNGLDDTVYQKYIHHFTLKVRKELTEAGYDLVESYSCGPCRMCAAGCNSNGDCRAPQLRLFALEACGFWVNHLCRKAAEHPVLGGDNWEINWLTDWNLPTQTPPTYRSVTGILLR